MKYVVQFDLDPETGIQVEAEMGKTQELIQKWQALNPIGFYFSMVRRRGTIIVDVPNEDSMFEALHATWVQMKWYPEVWPVLDLEEFGNVVQRLGMAP